VPILLFEIGAICHLLSGAAIGFNDGLCSISATVASNSSHSMQRKDKSRKLTKIGLSAAASRCKAPAMGMPALFGSRPGQ
jgi:hypothetical protein